MHKIKYHEKPASQDCEPGMMSLAVQLYQIECTCGWKTDWEMSFLNLVSRAEEHVSSSVVETSNT